MPRVIPIIWEFYKYKTFKRILLRDFDISEQKFDSFFKTQIYFLLILRFMSKN